MTRPTIYIAGKITGLPELEAQENFDHAERKLQELGYDTFNPFKHAKDTGIETHSWERIMKSCIANMMTCDGVLMLHNWQDSKGACLERTIAISLNMPITYPGADAINLN